MIKIKKIYQDEPIKIKTESGKNGKSAYELAVQQGFEGTLEEWLKSLKGKDGINGKDGEQGPQGIPRN